MIEVKMFAKAKKFATSRATRTYEVSDRPQDASGTAFVWGWLVRQDGRRVGRSLVYVPNIEEIFFAAVSR